MCANQEGDSEQLESGKTLEAQREAISASHGAVMYFNSPKKFGGRGLSAVSSLMMTENGL